MSIFIKQALVESFPAYNVFEREQDSNGFINITSQDILGVKHPKGFYRTYSPGSVVSYALQYNEDPIQAVADAKQRGHALHWINGRGACLTAEKRAAETVVAVTIGMKVRFEGLLATIEADFNSNIKFVPCK
jgi:Na+/H+-translocating membrane pyrophosphatase